MRILITGICGFVGSVLAKGLLEHWQSKGEKLQIFGVDNFSRPGSEINRLELKKLGIKLFYGDIRQREDIDSLPGVDWLIDAAANASVLAGVDGSTSSRQIMDYNLCSTINILEYCKKHKAGFLLLSTSRVYSIAQLSSLPMVEHTDTFALDNDQAAIKGVSAQGITESFPTTSPISLYGVSKLASENIALEYGDSFNFPVWINRCGVLAGAGQFGRVDQGIFSFWINSYLRKQPLRYIGFSGTGKQVRDCFHPLDLVGLIINQISSTKKNAPRVYNLGGGPENSMSLKQLSYWCRQRFGNHEVHQDKQDRPFDIPWMVMDHSLAEKTWGWRPRIQLKDILNEIGEHAHQHVNWLKLSESF